MRFCWKRWDSASARGRKSREPLIEVRPHDPHPSPPLKGEGVSITLVIELNVNERRMKFPSPLRGGARGGGREASLNSQTIQLTVAVSWIAASLRSSQ